MDRNSTSWHSDRRSGLASQIYPGLAALARARSEKSEEKMMIPGSFVSECFSDIGPTNRQKTWSVNRNIQKRRSQSRGGVPSRKVESVKILMKIFLSFLSSLEYRPRLLNRRIARESL